MFKILKRVHYNQLIFNKLQNKYNSFNSFTTISNLKYIKEDNVITKYNLNLYCKFNLFSNHDRFNLYHSRINCRKLFISQNCYDCENNTTDGQQDAEKIKKVFPQPKGILHNFFYLIATEMKNPALKVTPQYKLHPHVKNESSLHWSCTYTIKWPKEVKFQKSGISKQEASTKAALSVLIYLQKLGKISRNGSPIIYDANSVKKITKESHFSIHLSQFERENLIAINNLFENKLKPLINKEEMNFNYSFENNNVITSDKEVLEDWFNTKKLSSKRLDHYKAKETIKLPIQDFKQEFLNLLDNNQIIIVRGEPGCGKSTRIPQYALEHFVLTNEHANARIIVTQPRKIAAISLAERVAQERSERVGNVCGYQVRLKSLFNPKTGKILYVTTGILLRQIQANPNLSNYTHIILDEAHERDVNTDLLMSLMRHALNNNPNLKLIIMSATIDVGLFQKYFNNPPVMNIPGFTYPVKQHFLEDLNLDLHRTADVWNKSQTYLVYEEIAKVIYWIHNKKPEGAILVFLPGWEDIIQIKQLLMHLTKPNTCTIVTIHSKLSHEEQKKIFRKVPPGVRKIILATNIAETSVTVDDVVYVVDTGIHKEIRFDNEKGISCIDNHRISQSSMQQRKGRAGRVQPGESFHIYPKQCYNELLKFSLPEILRASLTKIVLDAKVYSHNANSFEFFSQLPCPPAKSTVQIAVDELEDLEMLDENENLTPLGRVVSDFQLPPKLSKAMIYSVIYKCVIPIVDIATLFSFESDMFSNTLSDKEEIRGVKRKMSHDSDHIALMILFEQWANMMNNNDLHEAAVFCTKYNLIPQKLNTLKQLKDIHYEYLQKYLRNALHLSDDFSANKEFIKGVLLSGVGSVLLQRDWDFVKRRLRKQKVFITRNEQKAVLTSESVNYKKNEYNSPFLVYINETRSELRRMSIIRETSVIKPLTFILFKNSDLTFHPVSYNNKTDIIDPILIEMKGTKFKLLCNREEAILLQQCKVALNEMEKYFVYQLTTGGQEMQEITNNWNEMLNYLNEMLKSKRN